MSVCSAYASTYVDMYERYVLILSPDKRQDVGAPFPVRICTATRESRLPIFSQIIDVLNLIYAHICSSTRDVRVNGVGTEGFGDSRNPEIFIKITRKNKKKSVELPFGMANPTENDGEPSLVTNG